MGFVNNGNPLYTIDSDTGEYTGLVIGSGDRVVRSKSVESFKKLQDDYIPFNDGRDFVKVFPDLAAKLCKRLTPLEMWCVIAIQPYIASNSGILMYRNGKFLSRGYLVDEYKNDQSERNIDRALSGLISKGILAKCKIGGKVAYIANPHVFQRGSKANATLLSLFRYTDWGG